MDFRDPGPSSAYYSQFASTSTGEIRPESPPSSPLLAPAHDDVNPTSTPDHLYAILNVSRDASPSDIRDAYRSLAHTFHPDRQRNDQAKARAHVRFQEIHRAYEVLSDPDLRTRYDLFGEEGLRSSWDVGKRNMTPDEMRRHFNKQMQEQRQVEAEKLVKSKGSMNMVVDARAVFLDESVFDDPESVKHDVVSRLRRVRPQTITMKHSFETAVGERTQVVWAGQMASRKGAGGANVIGTVRHQFSSKLWGEVGTTFLHPRVLTGKGTWTVDDNTYITVNAVQQTVQAPPRVSLTLGRKLYENTTGYITYRSGFFNLGSWGESLPLQMAISDRSAMSVGLTTARRDGSSWTVETQAGLVASHITADYGLKLFGLALKVGVTAESGDGMSAFVDAGGKVTRHVRTGVTLQAQWGGGVIMKWRFSRLGQSVSLPIMLTHDLNPYVLAGVTVLPSAVYLALYKYVILPKKKRDMAGRVEELREQHADYIAQKKAEALESVSILEKPTASRLAAEKAKRGLVIVEANYGHADSFTPRGMREQNDAHGERYIDVTIPIQALVADSKLVIPGGRGKHNLIGFWDPCIGEGKKLRIRYLFREVLHEVTLDDSAAVRLPVKAHAVGQ